MEGRRSFGFKFILFILRLKVIKDVFSSGPHNTVAIVSNEFWFSRGKRMLNSRVRVRIVRPVMFAVAFTSVAFGSLGYMRAERYKRQEQEERSTDYILRKIFNVTDEPMLKMKKTKQWEIVELFQDQYRRTRDSQKVVYGIVAANSLVLLLWRIPTLHLVMKRHFMHNPSSHNSHTLVTSAFSHVDVMHFAFNMMALWSFFPALQERAGMSPEQAVFFYLSAATAASLGSHIATRVLHRPALPSVGASGAIWAVVASTAYHSPETRAGIIFIPGFSLPLDQMVGILGLADLVGLLRGWRTFDHAAHLCGLAYGIIYSMHGFDLWSEAQKRLNRSTKK